MGFKIRKTIEKDLDRIISFMRDVDKKEIWSSGHRTANESVKLSFKQSDHCYTLLCDGVPIAICGVAKALDLKGGIVWMLGTDDIEKNPVSIVKATKFLIKKHENDYLYYFNYIHDDNEITKEWVKKLGFKVSHSRKWGVEGDNFRHIYKENKKCVM